MKDNISKMLIKYGCYVNASRNNCEKIVLPNGERVIAYLSCRLAISNVELREIIEEQLANKIKQTFNNDITIMGMATAGISWAHGIAQKLKLPMLYMRSNEKSYGLKGLIEGNIEYATKKVVIVDDIIYTGNTINKAKEELKKYGMDLVGIACIVTLGNKKEKEIKKENIEVIKLTDYNHILNAALEMKVLNDQEYKIMKENYEKN